MTKLAVCRARDQPGGVREVPIANERGSEVEPSDHRQLSQHDLLLRAITTQHVMARNEGERPMVDIADTTVCRFCGRTLPAQKNRGRQRQFCDSTCRSAARRHRQSKPRSPSFVNEGLTAAGREASLDIVAADRPGQPLAAVAAARDRVRRAEETLRTVVDEARSSGHTWQEIGDVLGTTRQAAFQRFGRPVDPRTGVPMAEAVLPGVTEHAIGVLADIVEHRWELSRRDFNAIMLDKIDAERLAAVWAQVIGMVGSYEHLGEPFVHQAGDYTVVDVPLYFEAGEMVGQVSYDRDRKVAGLFITRPIST
jgi:Protein of unknown function (DUF3887)